MSDLTAPPQDPGSLSGERPDPVPEPVMDDRERRLDPRVVLAWRLSTAVRQVIFLGALAFGGWAVFPEAGLWITLGLLLFAVAWVIWFPPARFRRWRWAVTDVALELRRGVIVSRHEAVPYFRIQQIDIRQGPFDRMLGLAELTVSTASASGSATLPGIPAEDAPEVRMELLRRAAAALGDSADGARDAV